MGPVPEWAGVRMGLVSEWALRRNVYCVARQMGAELMSFTLLTDLPRRESRYQPRHSSSRWARAGSGRLAEAMRVAFSRSWAGQPESPRPPNRFLAPGQGA